MYYKSLLTFLQRYHYLTLPSMGRLEYVKTSARIDENFTSILPLAWSIEFIPIKETISNDQLAFLSKAWDCKESEVVHCLDVLSSNFLEELATYNSCKIPPVGAFIGNEKQYIFATSQEFIHSINYLNTNQVVPVIPDTKEEFKEATTENSDNTGLVALDTSSYITLRPKYYKSVAATLLVMIVAMVGLNMMSTQNKLFHPVTFQYDTSEYAPDQINRSPETDGTDKNIDHYLSESDSMELLAESAKKNEDKVLEIEATQDAEVIDDLPESRMINAAECIYITGSFTKEINAEKMYDMMTSKGFKPYKAPFKGLTRIGVVIPCGSSESLHELSLIEENFWLLQ